MLDSVTKKRIDDLRNILVGKIPSPQSQVEQITTGLIYKFMYDMDNESIKMGGIPSFFVDEFEKYSWKHLFNSKLGGVEKVKLYSEAIENLYNNPHAPSIFREIFKNSFLPFKDPSTLNMFLKEINNFDYSNSEKLGDAYEYLLSFMGSQGDAGQFRTPRHIIDFIIQIVNPQKNENILDPACGTSGFLISSYKYILNQNTQTRIGDKLNASERKQIGDNLVGYDIDPAMSRISHVNMYLHNFTSPNIYEYDTISSEDRWNEYFDVILANPPFFSPTGGIKPHSRFGVKSTRAEVLFVDYIIEHLKPNGRAGIIVPEGIIFQTGTAYKILRKKLVEDCLIGVISLPAGVFQPYSGVKTSILICDKELNQKSENIFFAEIKNDGFSLGAQRTPIFENDLPNTLKDYLEFVSGNKNKDNYINKELILSSKDLSLSVKKHLFKGEIRNINFLIQQIKEICEVGDGNHSSNYPKNSEMVSEGIPFIRGTNISNYTVNGNDLKFITPDKHLMLRKGHLKTDDILFTNRGEIGKLAIVPNEFNNSNLNSQIAWLRPNPSLIIPKFLLYILSSNKVQEEIQTLSQGATLKQLTIRQLKEISIPIPPLDFQKKLLNELESYQKVIDGCRQVLDNYKPTIEFDPSWEEVELIEISNKITDGSHNPPKEKIGGSFKMLSSKNIQNNKIIFKDFREIDEESFEKEDKRTKISEGDVLLTIVGTIGRTAVIENNIDRFTLQRSVAVIKLQLDKCLPKFLSYLLQTDYYQKILNENAQGVAQKGIYLKQLQSLKMFIPSLEVQLKIVNKIDEEIKIINSNQQLIQNFSKKIEDKINKIWNN